MIFQARIQANIFILNWVPGGVGAVHVALQDLAREAKVGDLAHQLRVDQHVPEGRE